MAEEAGVETEADDAAPGGEGAGEGGAGAAPEGAESKTLADGGGEEKAAAAPADWPEDWRDKLAGDDAKLLKQLGRMGSPADLFKSYRAMQAKMSSGEMKAALPENPTDAELAEWREANGVPAKAEDYLTSLPEGVVLGDEDKALAGEFAAQMHEANAPASFVQQAIAWQRQAAEKQAEAQAEADRAHKDAAVDELRAEWGAEFRANLNSAKNMVEAMAPDMGEDGSFFDLVMGGRTNDGKIMGNDPRVMKFFAAMARELNPAGTVVPGDSGSQAKSIDAEIEEIKGVMRTDRARYNKDEKMQARYRDLLSAKEKLAQRAA